MSLMATEEDYLKTLEFTDEQSFEKLFRYYYEPLANFALKYLGNPEEAEEIVQEVFTYVWQKKGQLDIKTNPKSYLYGAVRNGCLNHIKHQKVENLYVQRALHSSDQFDQVDIMELNELEATIHAALEKLPPKCKEVFELNRIEGKRYKEIAEHLNISLKTVENQMGKALKVMRVELKELLPVLLLVLLEILQNGNGGKW